MIYVLGMYIYNMIENQKCKVIGKSFLPPSPSRCRSTTRCAQATPFPLSFPPPCGGGSVTPNLTYNNVRIYIYSVCMYVYIYIVYLCMYIYICVYVYQVYIYILCIYVMCTYIYIYNVYQLYAENNLSNTA